MRSAADIQLARERLVGLRIVSQLQMSGPEAGCDLVFREYRRWLAYEKGSVFVTVLRKPRRGGHEDSPLPSVVSLSDSVAILDIVPPIAVSLNAAFLNVFYVFFPNLVSPEGRQDVSRACDWMWSRGTALGVCVCSPNRL